MIVMIPLSNGPQLIRTQVCTHLYIRMWQSQVENELVVSLECFIEITPDFLCPFMND